MQGQILDFSIQNNSGVISGEDGSRYTFNGEDWRENISPVRGMKVDFTIDGSHALEIYKISSPSIFVSQTGTKSKFAAGLLAILLGYWGVHKFYLGYTGPGLVYLLVNTVGFFVTVFLLGIPNMVLGVIALIEGIIYLTLSDEDFENTYVQGTKHWF